MYAYCPTPARHLILAAHHAITQRAIAAARVGTEIDAATLEAAIAARPVAAARAHARDVDATARVPARGRTVGLAALACGAAALTVMCGVELKAATERARLRIADICVPHVRASADVVARRALVV